MTIIAYRDGVIAADSRVTVDTEAGGTRMFRCEKLFRKTIKEGRKKVQVIIATSGESAPGLIFVDWYGTDKPPPAALIEGDADFSCLILRSDGLYEADKYCRPEKIMSKFYAIGSGTKVALGAMEMGATAKQAAEIACKYDPHCAPPVVTMRLKKDE
jgi:hypothetical protein